MVRSIDSTPMRAAVALDAVHGLAPKMTARAPAIEAVRRRQLDLVRDLAAAGCFRMLVSRSHGDGGVDLAGAMRLCRRGI